MKITTTKIWKSFDIQQYCIQNGYYTAGDNEEYSAMLDYVETHKPTPNNIYTVAMDIIDHTPELTEDLIASIMFDINKYCVNTFFQ